MSNRVFLHVGLPKSGTTFLQGVLSNNKRRLAQEGLLFPGKKGWNSQVLAVRDVRNMPSRGRDQRKKVRGSWDRLAQEIQAWSGDAVVSMEWLSRVQPEHLDRIVTTLSSKELHVVFTVRDLARVIPASWQESVLNKREASWPEFLGQISDESLPREDRPLWRLHDLLPLIGRWTSQVPVERIHVVTVPPPGAPPEALWQRFAGVLGVEDVPVDMDLARRNDGLGVTSSELMRRVNIRAREQGLDDKSRRIFFTRELAKQGLVGRADQAGRPTIPPAWHPWVEAEAEARIEGLRTLGVDVVGDLEDLRPDLSKHLEEAAEPTAEALLEVALDAMVTMALQRAEDESASAAATARLKARHAKLTKQHERLLRRHTRQVERWQSRPLRSAARAYASRTSSGARLVRRLARKG